MAKGIGLHRQGFLSLFIVCACSSASAQTITAVRIGGSGNISTSQGNCYRTVSSIGQPVVLPSTGGTFTVRPGFLIGHGDLDSIFHQGFEVCA